MDHQEYITQAARAFTDYIAQLGLDSSQSAELARAVFDRIADVLAEREDADTDCVEAPNAVVEVIDSKTKLLFRRYLELSYLENNNGLRLSGEDMAGKASQIVFLSEQAIMKMKELQGDGQDEPRCH